MCTEILTVLENIFTEGYTCLLNCGISTLELHGNFLFVAYECPVLFISENVTVVEFSTSLSLFELHRVDDYREN